MTDVCIYTANYGRHDQPRPICPQDIDVDWHYYTDDGAATNEATKLGWVAHRVLRDEATPMMQAKWWKMHPPVGREYAIWIDANMEVTSPSFAREAMNTIAFAKAVDGGAGTFAVWKHPRRDDWLDEIRASTITEAADKYADCAERMYEQADAYFALGMPRHTGLYACGTIVWTPDAWPLALDWWNECVDWTPQDQVSLPFVCWARNEWPAVFPILQIDHRLTRTARLTHNAPYLANRWLRIWPHG